MTTSAPILLVDLDGVMVDSHAQAMKGGGWNHYPCQWNFPGCCTDKTYDEVFADSSVFGDAPPIEGALDAMRILSRFFEIHFVSTPWIANHGSAEAKFAWVERMGFSPQMLTLTHRKELVRGWALVDDKPGLVGPWKHIEYPQPWNESLLPSWTNGLADWIIRHRP